MTRICHGLCNIIFKTFYCLYFLEDKRSSHHHTKIWQLYGWKDVYLDLMQYKTAQLNYTKICIHAGCVQGQVMSMNQPFLLGLIPSHHTNRHRVGSPLAIVAWRRGIVQVVKPLSPVGSSGYRRVIKTMQIST